MREIQLMSRFIFILSVAAEIYWISQIQRPFEYIIVPFGIFISVFFVNSVIHNIIALIIPGKWLWQNSEHLSCKYHDPRPDFIYPTLTIMIPIYKETFATIIRPTIDQAIEACSQYTARTGAAANVYINDDGYEILDAGRQKERAEYYDEHKNCLTFIARPAPYRRGKFKKAGNLNYAITKATNSQLGDIILLLDCDSRIAVKDIYRLVKEFQNPEVGFIQIKTATLYSSDRPYIWERLIGHFTDTIYSVAFHITCSYGDPSPLVGHNAAFRKAALFKCIRYIHLRPDTSEPILQIFSEEHVSEDFEISMRLQDIGYIGRYITHTEGFKEGVTLTTLDEIIRLQKYAYGCSELMMHPLCAWLTKGILCPTFKQYLLSSNITLASKYNVIGYIGTYYALALTPIVTTIHYFAYIYCPYWRGLYSNSENILYSCIGVFTLLTPISTMTLKLKLKEPINVFREMGYSLCYGLFFAGIGLHLLFAILSHFLGINMSWGSTNKEAGGIRAYLKSLKCLWGAYLISAAQLTLIGIGWYFLGVRSWPAIVPMGISACAHILVPFMSAIQI